MQLGPELTQQHCARCKGKLTVPTVFRDGEWYHRNCWNHGAHQLADANKISAQARHMHDLFPPTSFSLHARFCSSSYLNTGAASLFVATVFLRSFSYS